MSKDTTTIPVHDILPIRIIRDNYIISEDGCITVGYLLSLPVWGEITKEDYSSFVDSFKKALRNLPDWTLVHRQDIFLKARVPVVGLAKDLRDKDSFLSEKHREHFKEREYMTHFQRIFFTHNPNNPSRKSLMRGKFLQSGIGKARVTIVPQQEKINEFCSITRDFMNSVFSYRNSILFRELCREDYVGLDNGSGLLESYLSLSDCESSKSISMLSDLYCEDGDSISIGKKHMIGFNLSCASDFPSEISDCTPYHRMKCSLGESVVLGYSHPISLCMDCEHILNTYIIKADQQSIKRDLEAKYRRMHSMSSETYNEINGKQIRKYLKRLESEDLLSVYHRTGILAWGQGKGSENAVEHAVRNALSSMNICARRISKVLPEEYIYGIPGCEMDFSENDYMLEEVSASSCLVPWETFDKGLPGGSLSLVERISSRPINLDLSVEAFSKGWINAYNAFVLGPTGSGKSFFMNHFLRCCHDRGARICILDNGKSYVGLDALVKQEKTKNESSRTRKKANAALAQTISNFNPFAGFISEGKWLISESKLDLENPSVQFFLGLVKTICSLPEG